MFRVPSEIGSIGQRLLNDEEELPLGISSPAVLFDQTRYEMDMFPLGFV